MWSMLELNVGVITACMPAIKLFVRWIRGPKPTTHNGSENPTIGGGGYRKSTKPSATASSRSGRYQMTVQPSQEVVLLEAGAGREGPAESIV